MTDTLVRVFQKEDLEQCATIFAGLGDWFGLPDAVEAYLKALPEHHTLVVETAANNGERQVAAFLSVRRHSDHAAEIHLIAVDAAQRGRGLGRLLVLHAEAYCRAQGITFLQVKTLDPSRENAAYAETRKFYDSLGFAHLETFPTLWDPANPARQLIKQVPRETLATLVERERMQPHPEGGYYRETWRSKRTTHPEDYDSPRNAGTSILYLLPAEGVSDWHRVSRADELWMWQAGSPIELTIGHAPDAPEQVFVLGPGERYQALVPADMWQTTRVLPGPYDFSLSGCVVVPGFDFRDFEMIDRDGGA